MKTVTLTLLFLLTSVFSFAQSIDELASDVDFVSYVNDFYRLTEIIGEKVSWDSTRLSEIYLAIEEAKNSNLSTEEQYNFVNETIGLTEEDSFAIYHQRIITSYHNLQDRYPDISPEVFSEAGAEVLYTDCGWRYAICAARVGFEGGLLLAACEGATAGIGTVLCLAGATAYLADGLGDCYDKYCK